MLDKNKDSPQRHMSRAMSDIFFKSDVVTLQSGKKARVLKEDLRKKCQLSFQNSFSKELFSDGKKFEVKKY